MKVFSKEELKEELQTLHDWQVVDAAIEKSFVFADFKKALGFIVQVGILAEQADHHPEIWNVYHKVKIRLNTHSVNGITSKDIDLAKQIDTL